MLASQINVELFNQPDSDDPIGIANAAVAHAKKNGYQVVIIDTAGRLAVDEVLMDEISAIHKSVSPSETLFVVDSMTGQDAVNTAKVFHDILNFDGVILTKLDGDTRGGAALSIKSVVDKPIKFISTGEKLDALDLFYPDRMAERILGMGDVGSLVERAQQVFDEEQAKKIQQKVKKNSFGFDDFLAQIKQVQKMGSMKDLVGMIPGANKISPDEIDEDAFKGIEAIIQSMTPKERSQPKLLNHSRKKQKDDNLKNVSIPKGINIDQIDLEKAKYLCSLPLSLGKNPENDKDITVNVGRFGPYLKCENKSARLENVDELFTIGLNRAVTLIAEAKPGRISSSMIKDLGEHPEDKKPVRIMKGQYGPYIKYKSLNATIPEEKDPVELTMEEALILIEKRKEYDRNKKKKKGK